jgi:hypothetical protein
MKSSLLSVCLNACNRDGGRDLPYDPVQLATLSAEQLVFEGVEPGEEQTQVLVFEVPDDSGTYTLVLVPVLDADPEFSMRYEADPDVRPNADPPQLFEVPPGSQMRVFVTYTANEQPFAAGAVIIETNAADIGRRAVSLQARR